MKIAVDATILEYDGRGISKATVAFYQNLKKIYPDIELFLLQKRDLVTDFYVDHVKIYAPSYMSDEIALKSYFPQKLKELKIDFVHFPFNGINVEYFKVVRPEIKTISTIHDIIPVMIPDVYKLSDFDIKKYLQDVQVRIDYTDILITISECSKNDLMNRLKLKTNPIVIYNSHFSKTPSDTQNKIGNYFLYNGGYCPRKGIDILVDNFLQLKFRGLLESKLVLTGEIQKISDRCQSLIEYGISRGWIIETGYIPDEELFNLFVNAKSLVYLSRYEGFGLPPLEAMNLGCPVITTSLSALPEVCLDAAYYVNRNDDEDIAHALIDLEKNHEIRNHFIQKGKIQAQKFSWEKSVEKFVYELKKRSA